MKFVILFLFLFAIFSCGNKSSEYVHHYNPPRKPTFDVKKPLKNLDIEGNIDILWVIDNSGSMGGIQSNVIKNSKIFMDQFVRQNFINWKMGVISTDRGDSPRIGFNTDLNSSMVNPSDQSSYGHVVKLFQDAVRDLGTNGDYSEYTFYNILRHISDYNGPNSNIPFLRTKSHLAVIMVTDEKEQSQSDFGSQYEALTFLNTLSAYVNPDKTIRFYGAFDFKDLKDCDSGWGDQYQNSAFKQIIDHTGGFHISACVPDFGTKLVEIGKDIASMISLPSLLLEQRPKAHTIRVWYEKLELKPGRPENGGYWYYDDYNNTINFYSLDFIDDIENAKFRVKFDIDDGIRRPGDPDDSKNHDL